MSTLEEVLIRNIKEGKDVDPEVALLTASGITSLEALDAYRQGITEILAKFYRKVKSKGAVSGFIKEDYMTVSRARLLFEYLWDSKPKRHGKGFSLVSAIDAQLDPDVNISVGSCIALTALYSVLCLREKIDVKILTDGDHILSRIKHDGISVNVENTDPFGFDIRVGDTCFRELPPIALVPSILNSRGIRENKEGDFQSALNSINSAISLCPDYSSAYNNRGNIYFDLGEYEMAKKDYKKAMELRSNFVEACFNLGLVHEKLGNTEKALYFFERTLRISPRFEEARVSLALIKERM